MKWIDGMLDLMGAMEADETKWNFEAKLAKNFSRDDVLLGAIRAMTEEDSFFDEGSCDRFRVLGIHKHFEDCADLQSDLIKARIDTRGDKVYLTLVFLLTLSQYECVFDWETKTFMDGYSWDDSCVDDIIAVPFEQYFVDVRLHLDLERYTIDHFWEQFRILCDYLKNMFLVRKPLSDPKFIMSEVSVRCAHRTCEKAKNHGDYVNISDLLRKKYHKEQKPRTIAKPLPAFSRYINSVEVYLDAVAGKGYGFIVLEDGIQTDRGVFKDSIAHVSRLQVLALKQAVQNVNTKIGDGVGIKSFVVNSNHSQMLRQKLYGGDMELCSLRSSWDENEKFQHTFDLCFCEMKKSPKLGELREFLMKELG
ncbi:hypothetical protein NHP190012_11190 [Helicobacter sp. NHP19-012]|uniref:Uncharacterized protein n=1 Tax=Helicobacter gastrofelis TaxID=2849642 RepID=A0ABN6I8Y9_9HELI|nr:MULTISPECIES: hypothetical protein [unclassified Helicobacter]BCZ19477.1 hypothetical protein NHP190012_11190 [Helicobacter sp. NHP19-012]GMB96464.1 hypothetical protein NHP22001_10530 [Helicobacter sp. NHP22-001]